MGQEARCLARIGERVVEVKALLESDELILRGEYRARLPFAGLDGVEAAGGRLTAASGRRADRPGARAGCRALGREDPQPADAAGQARRQAWAHGRR